jgi:hypothetical protein
MRLARLLFAGLIACRAVAHAPALAAQSAAWSRPSHADSTRLIHKGYAYGSDAYFSPITVQLNKGFDIFQLRHSNRDIRAVHYDRAWNHGIRGAWQHPGAAVRRFGGWGRMARIELLPLSLKSSELNWFVNYTEHLIGGGLTMRGLDEWYSDRGVPLPRVWAMLTTYSASILNEMSEQPNSSLTSPGGVADLLIFDVAAVTLFHWKQPAHFLAHTLQAADWSNQASFTMPNGQLQNNGQYFSLKIPVGFDRTRLFIRGGMGAQIGVSRKLADDEHHVSFGVGGDTQVREIDPTGHETVGFAPGAGVYYDRNNSLLWSVTASPAENLLAANVYPGVMPGIGGDIGAWGVYTRRGELRIGIVHRRALGLGVGYGR